MPAPATGPKTGRESAAEPPGPARQAGLKTYRRTSPDLERDPLHDGNFGADEDTLRILEDLRGNCPTGAIECREHDDDPTLAHRRGDDGRVHEAWLYVRRLTRGESDGTYLLLCHHPKNDPELKSTRCRLQIGMSDEHRIEQEYLYRAGDNAGFAMATEHQVPGARLDVYGEAGDTRFGFEVQLSALGAAIARRRDRAALSVNVPLVWTTDRADAPWAAKHPLAHITTADIPGRRAPLGSWRVAGGLRSFELRPCTPRWFDGCPETGKGVCRDGRHPVWEADVREGRLSVDDVLVGVGEGRYARLDTGTKQGVALVPAEKARQWHEYFGPTIPTVPAPRRADPDEENGPRRDCSYGRVNELPVPVQRAVPGASGPREVHTVRTMTDQGEVPAESATILGRMRRAGISEARARAAPRAGSGARRRRGREQPRPPLPWPERWIIGPR